MSAPSDPRRASIPSDHAMSFPLDSLTDHQRQLFVQFIDVKRETGSDVREPIWFALVLVGEKPAMRMSHLKSSKNDVSTSVTAKQVAEAFDLVYRQYFEYTLDVARSSWRFGLLPFEGRNASVTAYFRRRGCFYGYPKQDVEYFIETTGWDVHPTELAKEGVIRPEEAAYMAFLPHRYDAAEHYERAIESGKRIREIITDCATKWNFGYLDEHADRVYQKALERCTP